MPAVGTLGWAERTRGTLRRRDRLALHAQVAGVVLARLPRRALRRLGLRPERAEADLDAIRPPDTPAARAASELCAEASSPALAGHAERTYLWARLLGLRDGAAYDDELLYVGCVLHDLGFTERFWGRAGSACFSVDGGAAARELAERLGWPRARCDALEEAIVLHLNLVVPRRRGVEAHLLQAGTVLDVTGARLGAVAPIAAQAVLARHPRGALKEEMAGWFARETAARPGARLHYLDRVVALGARTASAPF